MPSWLQFVAVILCFLRLGYDSANNWLTKLVVNPTGSVTTSYSYNLVNQLTGYGNASSGTTTRAVSLSYDANGNRTGRTITGAADAGTDSYTYDRENRLVGLTKGTAGTGTGTYAYQYDYRTRRILRDESSANGASTQVIYSGGTSK